MASLCIPRNPRDPFRATNALRRHLHIGTLDVVRDLYVLHKSSTLLAAVGMSSHVDSVAFGSATASQPLNPTQREVSDYPKPLTTSLAVSSSAVVQTLEGNESPIEQPLEDTATQSAIPLSDIEVEALVKRINESVVIQDLPIKDPQWIQVPKGYLMDLELQPSEFFKNKADFKNQVKKRKREAALAKWTNKGWQNRIRGFRPEEVNWNGAVCMDNCQESNLTNEIHPLFDRCCFDDTPDAIYDQLIPALRLATLFLTRPVCMQFWVTLAMGKRKNDAEMSVRNGKLSQRINNHVELTEERARTVMRHLNEVGESKLIHFRFNRGLQSDLDTDVYALSLPICDYRGLDGECHNVRGSLLRSVIRFHADYYVAAKKLSQLRFQEVSQKLRFSFGFAVLIVHEIAHSIEGIHFRERDHQWLDWHSSQYYKEPYWLDWNESECGRAWEETIFGGHLQPINRRVDGSHGIAIADWPFGGTDEDPQHYRWWTVSMDYIEHMFQMSTWERQFDLKDWRIFNIPRDGATSLYINSFSTMNPSEEERVAKEEMAEVVARSNEEPATKKRVTALGETEERRLDEIEVIDQAVVDESETSANASSKRQVPVFRGTRRLSPILIPHSRRASSGESKPSVKPQAPEGPAKASSWVAFGLRSQSHDGFTPKQRKFLEEQRHKDLTRSLQNRDVGNTSSMEQSTTKEPTTELVKKTKAKPKGILQKHKERKKAGIAHQRTEEIMVEEPIIEIGSKGPGVELDEVNGGGGDPTITRSKDATSTQILPQPPEAEKLPDGDPIEEAELDASPVVD